MQSEHSKTASRAWLRDERRAGSRAGWPVVLSGLLGTGMAVGQAWCAAMLLADALAGQAGDTLALAAGFAVLAVAARGPVGRCRARGVQCGGGGAAAAAHRCAVAPAACRSGAAAHAPLRRADRDRRGPHRGAGRPLFPLAAGRRPWRSAAPLLVALAALLADPTGGARAGSVRPAGAGGDGGGGHRRRGRLAQPVPRPGAAAGALPRPRARHRHHRAVRPGRGGGAFACRGGRRASTAHHARAARRLPVVGRARSRGGAGVRGAGAALRPAAAVGQPDAPGDGAVRAAAGAGVLRPAARLRRRLPGPAACRRRGGGAGRSAAAARAAAAARGPHGGRARRRRRVRGRAPHLGPGARPGAERAVVPRAGRRDPGAGRSLGRRQIDGDRDPARLRPTRYGDA